jgi:hypothetical protein
LTKAEFKYLEHCEPGDLIRLRLSAKTQWAIVGQRTSNNYLPLVTIEEKPSCLNVSDQIGGVKDDFNRVAVLHYGSFDIEPDHRESCEVGPGTALLLKPGSFLITKEDRYLSCTEDQSIAFLCLSNWKIHRNTSTAVAAFSHWNIWPKQAPDDEALIAFP